MMTYRGRNMQWCKKENKEIKIVAIDGTPKQVIVTDATGYNPPKLKINNKRNCYGANPFPVRS
jgi:adenylate cyclase class IV